MNAQQRRSARRRAERYGIELPSPVETITPRVRVAAAVRRGERATGELRANIRKPSRETIATVRDLGVNIVDDGIASPEATEPSHLQMVRAQLAGGARHVSASLPPILALRD